MIRSGKIVGQSSGQAPRISVVVPVFDEQENVVPLHREIRDVLVASGDPFEILFVDDGSTDATLERLDALADGDPHLRVVELDGNFGEAAALSAGFQHARGELVVTLDGDGQNDPADIPRLLAAFSSADVRAVSGRRERRQEDFWLRVLPSRIANALIARVTGIPVHDCGCGLKAYRREALHGIQLPAGMHRFLPSILGVRTDEVAEVPTRDRARRSGRSHYGIGRGLAVVRDLLALPFLIRDASRARMEFALATGGLAVLGALAQSFNVAAMIAFDVAALLAGVVWWNARRFCQAQAEGVYRLRRELDARGAPD